MRLLYDTVTLIWLANGDRRVPEQVIQAYRDPANEIFVSVMSILEFLIKVRNGKLPPPPGGIDSFPRHLARTPGLTVLPLTEADVLNLMSLPSVHGDPFDRAIVCQAIERDLTLVTPDADMRKYPVKSLW